MKYRELEKRLSGGGCYEVRKGANHPIWFSPITGNAFPTSNHKSQEVKPGTLKSIERLSGVKL